MPGCATRALKCFNLPISIRKGLACWQGLASLASRSQVGQLLSCFDTCYWHCIAWSDSVKLSNQCLYAGVQEGNKQESVLAWPSLARPSFTFANSIEDIIGSGSSSSVAQVGSCHWCCYFEVWFLKGFCSPI